MMTTYLAGGKLSAHLTNMVAEAGAEPGHWPHVVYALVVGGIVLGGLFVRPTRKLSSRNSVFFHKE